MKPRKIAVLGAGAVGSALGGFFALAGHEVCLVGRGIAAGSHLDRVRSAGLRIDGIRGDHHCRPRVAAALPAGDDEPDLILLCVKSFDTAAAAEQIAAAGGDCPVLHLQNGIGNYEILRGRLGADRVLSGMIIIGFTIPEPGAVRVTVYGGDIRIGRMGSSADRGTGQETDREAGAGDRTLRETVDLFQDLPFAAHAADDIESQLWAKLLYNSALNPLGAIFGTPYGRLLADDAQAIIREVLAEAFAVAGGLGVRLFWPDSESYRAHLVGVQIPATADHFPSMGADLRQGRRTEIDFLNGAVVRAAPGLGLRAPVNETLVRQIRFLEQGAGRPGAGSPFSS